MPKLVLRPGLCPGPRWGSLPCSPRPLAVLRGPTCKGRERQGEGREEEGREGEQRRGKLRLHFVKFLDPPLKAPSQSLTPLVKAHTKLPILHIRIWQWATEIEITMRYGYAASTGSLVWALNKRTRGQSNLTKSTSRGAHLGVTQGGRNLYH